MSGELIFGNTKSHAVRTVPIPPRSPAALTRHLKTVDKSPDALLFRGPKGGPIRHRYAYIDSTRAMALPGVHDIERLRQSKRRHRMFAIPSPRLGPTGSVT